MVALEFVVGLAWFVLATVLFRIIGPKEGTIPAWTQLPGMHLVIIFAILGGWSIGGAFVVHALAALAS
jgi:hypothetical protein